MFFSEAAERNKGPILEHLQQWLKSGDSVLEIGSGTGQHACFFVDNIPAITWQCSDLAENILNLEKAVINEGLVKPIALDVSRYDWCSQQYDVIYSANSLHIMSWECAQAFLNNAANALNPEGRLILYGPFEYTDKPLCESNQSFDHFLRTRDPLSGIRNFDTVNNLLEEHGFKLVADLAMPANNQLIIWHK